MVAARGEVDAGRGGHAQPLLRSKLRPAATTPYFVVRTRLIAQLDAIATCPLVLVVAPAGSGKTQVVSNWVTTTRLRTAWISLDELDDDPIECWTGLMAALEHLAPGCSIEPVELLRSGARLSAVVGCLLDNLERDVHELGVLVIDDVHLLNDPEPVGSLSLFVRHLPDWLHVILVGRSDPALPLERLRVRGQVAEIRFHDLKLSSDEARQLLAGLSPSLTESDLERAVAQTDGWAAGLQLTALAARSAEITGVPVTMSRDVELLTDDYVWSEILATGDPEIIELLLELSIVDRVDTGMANAISDSPHPRELLLRGESSGLFVFRLGADGWFRVHALVREVLYRELVRQDRHRLYHERAALWLERAGETVGALEQWLLADRPLEALRLVSSRSTELYDRGREAVIARTIAAIPRREIAGDPGALIDFAVSLMLFSRPTFVAAVQEAVWHAERSRDRDRSAQIDALEAVALVMSGSWTDGGMRARRARDALGDDWWSDPAGRFVWNSEARSIALTESWDDSSEFVTSATIAMRRDPERGLSLEGIRALGLAMSGRPVDALRVAAGLHHAASSMSILGSEIAIAEAIARREIGDHERALSLLHDIAGQPANPRLYSSVAAHLALSSTAVDDGDIDAAAHHLERASEMVANEQGGADLREWLARMETVVAIESGDGATAATAAASLGDTFWGPVSRARVAIASLDTSAARFMLADARPRSIRHAVVLGLIRARVAEHPDEALVHATDAIELASSASMVQTVASEGREILELVERGAWSVSGDWLDRVRVAATHRRIVAPTPGPGFVEVLTARERDVLRLLPSRLTVSEMARELYISVNTLKFHLKVIYRKLGVHSRKEAAEVARSMTRLGPVQETR